MNVQIIYLDLMFYSLANDCSRFDGCQS